MSAYLISSPGGHKVELELLTKELGFLNSIIIEAGNKNKKPYIVDCSKSTPFKVFLCVIQIFLIFVKNRPRFIISTGAAPGAIAIILGKLFGAKTIWVDSMANIEKVSLSGKICLKFCDQFYSQWEHLACDNIKFEGGIL